ncbi:hypothetical protein A8M77_29395 [Variovorax sp. JS1663]|nr:hypothetical protein A8M77_29395 [Variovorax sp. JS1663]
MGSGGIAIEGIRHARAWTGKLNLLTQSTASGRERDGLGQRAHKVTLVAITKTNSEGAIVYHFDVNGTIHSFDACTIDRVEFKGSR